MCRKDRQIALVLVLLATGFLTGGACPSTRDSLEDEVKKLLDRKDATAVSTAPDKADELVAAEDTPTNRLLATSAYARRAEVNLLDLVGQFADLIDLTAVSDFQQIACLVQMSDPTNNLADLRSAIERLDAIEDTVLTEAENKESVFQLGMLQALEAFILPTNRGASPDGDVSDCSTASFTVNASTLSNLTEADRTNVQNSFVEADNRLRASGLENEDEILQALFENYCRLREASAGSGFTLEDLRAFVGCELEANSVTAFTGVANCLVFLQEVAGPNASAISTCKKLNDLVP